MKYARVLLITGGLCLGRRRGGWRGQDDFAALERQFRELPMEARRLLGPLFWLHGDETRERLEMYVAKVAEGGNGCFTHRIAPASRLAGPGLVSRPGICLEAAKKHHLKMWIFDEKWLPSQARRRKSARRAMPPSAWRPRPSRSKGRGPGQADGYGGERYIAAVAGR